MSIRSDRNPNELVATASVGLAISAVTASVIVAEPSGDKNPVEFYLTKVSISLMWGMVGAIAGCFLWKIYIWLSRFCRKKLE